MIGRSGPHAGMQIPLEQELIIGRDSSLCQLILPKEAAGVSGVHCKLTLVSNSIQLTDMGSTNGTFLENQVRLTPNFPTPLKNGDIFYLSDHGYEYSVSIVDPPPPPPPPPPKKVPGFAIAAMVTGILAVISALLSAGWYFPQTRALLGFCLPWYIPFIFAGVSIPLAAIALWKKNGKRMAIGGLVCAIIASAFLGSVLAVWEFRLFEPPRLEGSWTCVEGDLVDGSFRETIKKALPEAGYESNMADVVVDAMGFDKNDLIFTFEEDGSLLFGSSKRKLEGENFLTWEDLGNNQIKVKADLSLLTSLPARIPISLSYTCEYALANNALTMDFFGEEVHFTRFTR